MFLSSCFSPLIALYVVTDKFCIDSVVEVFYHEQYLDIQWKE